MNIIEAIKKMKKGKKIKRKNWFKDDYLYIDEKIIKDDGGNDYHLAIYELVANNWEIFTEEKLKIRNKNHE